MYHDRRGDPQHVAPLPLGPLARQVGRGKAGCELAESVAITNQASRGAGRAGTGEAIVVENEPSVLGNIASHMISDMM